MEKRDRYIAAIGEIVVEIMASERGDGFTEAQPFVGPFASGAPAIFIHQAALLGQACGIASCVGDDDFGRMNLDRLRISGVDVRAVAISRTRPTGSAFVRYAADGSRQFIFNIAHSACGEIAESEPLHAMVDRTDHLHVMGSSLFSESLAALTLDGISRVKARGGTVSFDPNVRPEAIADGFLHHSLPAILSQTDVFLPSGDELFIAHPGSREREALDALFDNGVTVVVHKRGSAGARYHDRALTIDQSAFPVDETDPTGAGDSFGATFLTYWLRGYAPKACLQMAAAAGAIAVTKQGPMEGAASANEIEALAKTTGALT
ncbi:sugar kinase [Pararhizobium mangrovi]|uniref:Sugar kinase n=1 Tax=Pararhizobium mangrovi TaxID=2590452 RepID=A0A506UC71_9HYPH|nr:sugar kinase [Pararhizobium mangrovi]TPW30259.1 sugar kinase [Pararhizobium mangrovi]